MAESCHPAAPGSATAVGPGRGVPRHLGSPARPPASPIPPHDDAVGRLEGALAERGRRRRQYEAASDTPLEPNAYVRLCEVRLCEANEQVAARESWLEWIDQHWDRRRSRVPSERTR
jgi:hypothetical protein